MGADSRMYSDPSFQEIEGISYVDWPTYNGEVSIDAVARSVIKNHKIIKTCVVGGSSLGGMVAVQIAKIVGIEKVILIGSATAPSYVNPTLHKLSALADFAPIKLIQYFSGKAAVASNSVLFSMFEQSDPEFIKTMCRAIFKWEGLANYSCKVCHIHGSKDRVIFPPTNKTNIVQGGGHLIAMTHSDLVAKYFRDNINEP